MNAPPWSRNGIVYVVSPNQLSSSLFSSTPSRGFRSVYRIPLPEDEVSKDLATLQRTRSPHAVDDATILILLAAAAITCLLLLLCLVLCYKRKSNTNDQILEKMSAQSIPEPCANRSITFGSLPSWREERDRRQANRHIFGALDRIREADERSRSSVRSSQSGSAVESLGSGRSFFSDGHPKHGSLHLFRPRESRRSYSSSQLRQTGVFTIDGPQEVRRKKGSQRSNGSTDSVPIQIDGPSPSPAYSYTSAHSNPRYNYNPNPHYYV